MKSRSFFRDDPDETVFDCDNCQVENNTKNNTSPCPMREILLEIFCDLPDKCRSELLQCFSEYILCPIELDMGHVTLLPGSSGNLPGGHRDIAEGEREGSVGKHVPIGDSRLGGFPPLFTR